MTRSEISSLTGLSVRTIRFYEDKGIIPTVKRDPNGYRNYDTGMIHRLNFIKNAQNLGFSLGEIKDLANMRVTPDSSCDTVHSKAEKKIADIGRKIIELQRIEAALRKISLHCSPKRGIDECEFLQFLEK